MSNANRIRSIRTCFRVLSRDVLDDVIELSRLENPHSMGRGRLRAPVGQLRDRTFLDVGSPRTLKGYIDALPAQVQCELLACMVFGREPDAYSVSDMAALCLPTHPGDHEQGQYLASKSHLADYLERAIQILGL